jgi:hypothetical protein
MFAKRDNKNLSSWEPMVEGLLASVAADRDEFPSDLLRFRDLSALEFPA